MIPTNAAPHPTDTIQSTSPVTFHYVGILASLDDEGKCSVILFIGQNSSPQKLDIVLFYYMINIGGINE